MPRCWPSGWDGGSARPCCAGRCGAPACGARKNPARERTRAARHRRRPGSVAGRGHGGDRSRPARLPRRERPRHPPDPGLRPGAGRPTRHRTGPGRQLAAPDHPRRAGPHWRLVAVMTVAAATSTAVFLAFIEGMLIPMLHARPGAMVVMDNLAPHKAAGVRAALRQAGLEHRYLPAYSPDLNPIEPCWSKLKGELRSAAPRSLDALDNALPSALGAITPEDAQAWFHHCGYRST